MMSWLVPTLVAVAGLLLSFTSVASSAEMIRSVDDVQSPTDERSESSARLRRPTIALSSQSDSGLSKSDRITKETSLVFKGKAKPGSTVVIAEKAIGLAQGVVSKDGRYEIKVPKQAEGTHKFAAVQLIKPGVGYFSREVGVMIDTTLPTPPRLALTDEPRAFENGEAVIKGAAGKEELRIRVYERGKFLKEVSQDAGGQWSTGALKFSRGTHLLNAVAVDRAGNTSPPSESAILFMDISQREVQLVDLDRRTGILLRGGYSSDAGFDVTSIGDVNGDNIDDVAIGAPDASNVHGSDGRVHILFGSTKPFPEEINLSPMQGRFGVDLIGGRSDKRLGTVVSAAGDVNDDGIADILVSAPDSSTVYLVFGRKIWPSTVELARMKVGDGVKIAPKLRTCFGGALAGGGDVDGDGIDDIAIGCGAHRPSSHFQDGVYVIFGRSTGFPRVLTPPRLDRKYGVRLTGEGESFGYSVTIASDLNHDGIDDVVISEPTYNKNSRGNLGELHVLFGGRSKFNASSGLDATPFGRDLRLTGELDASVFGAVKVGTLAGGADLNADGIDDIAVTLESRGSSRNRSPGFVVFGRRTFERDPPVLSSLDGSDGFRIDFSHVGGNDPHVSLSFPGDVDGDGKADLMSTFPLQNHGAGSAFITYGRRSFPPVLYLQALDREAGYLIHGYDRGGHSGAHGDSGLNAAAAGDINGDGNDDIVFGAPHAGANQHPPGHAYVVFGRGER
jgi:hypothetical protein